MPLLCFYFAVAFGGDGDGDGGDFGDGGGDDDGGGGDGDAGDDDRGGGDDSDGGGDSDGDAEVRVSWTLLGFICHCHCCSGRISSLSSYKTTNRK